MSSKTLRAALAAGKVDVSDAEIAAQKAAAAGGGGGDSDTDEDTKTHPISAEEEERREQAKIKKYAAVERRSFAPGDGDRLRFQIAAEREKTLRAASSSRRSMTLDKRTSVMLTANAKNATAASASPAPAPVTSAVPLAKEAAIYTQAVAEREKVESEQKTVASGTYLEMRLRADGLAKPKASGAPNFVVHFLRLRRTIDLLSNAANQMIGDKVWVLAAKSESPVGCTGGSALNPIWPQQLFSADDLCHNESDRPILVQIYHSQPAGMFSEGFTNEFIGEFKTTLRDIFRSTQLNKKFTLVRPDKRNLSTGFFSFEMCRSLIMKPQKWLLEHPTVRLTRTCEVLRVTPHPAALTFVVALWCSVQRWLN